MTKNDQNVLFLKISIFFRPPHPPCSPHRTEYAIETLRQGSLQGFLQDACSYGRTRDDGDGCCATCPGVRSTSTLYANTIPEVFLQHGCMIFTAITESDSHPPKPTAACGLTRAFQFRRTRTRSQQRCPRKEWRMDKLAEGAEGEK